MRSELRSRDAILGARVGVPADVVFRNFASEMIVLNLNTGMYHSLNRTAGRMLEVLSESPNVAAAARALAQEYDQPVAQVEADVCGFCFELQGRGLITLGEPPA